MIFKKKNTSPKVKIYFMFVIITLLLAISELIAIYVFKATGEFKIYEVLWKIRIGVILVFVYTFILYYNLLLSKKSYPTLKLTFKNKPAFIVLGILFIILIIGYIAVGHVKLKTIDNIHYASGPVAAVLIVLSIAAVLFSTISGAWKTRQLHVNE